MKIRKLQLENFRNYEKYDFEFPEDKNVLIITGPNGEGKTNFLEAMHILSLTKSFRTSHKNDMIKWESDFFRCKCVANRDDEDMDLEVFFSIRPARNHAFKHNGVVEKGIDYIGHLLTVLFQPEDLNILYLSPSLRRKYLNSILAQTDKRYLLSLRQYHHILKQRNVLLDSIRSARFNGQDISRLLKDLDVWDEQFLDHGSQISKKRAEFINFLSKEVPKIYKKISEGSEKIEIKYRISELSPESIAAKRDQEVRYAQTKIGPHRDDIEFYIDGNKIEQSASRGEYRTLLLAMKLAEITYIENCTGEKPILLLDDVFSELDPDRQKHLLDTIETCQTIITTTDLDSHPEVGNSVIIAA